MSTAIKPPHSIRIEASVPILQTLGAMVGGVTTVFLTTALVERSTSKDAPIYSPSGERFDPSTYLGRFFRMLLACDPHLLLFGQDEVNQCRAMLVNHELLMENPPVGMSVQDISCNLWEARRIVSSTGSGENESNVIPLPFRMSGYVPFNGPVCVAMVTSTSTPVLLFWSWVNQSQNALVNYYNRAAGGEMSMDALKTSYLAAVTSALMLAFGLATWIQRRYDPTKARQLMRYVAFPSAMVASSLNCYIVRSPEIETGIPLLDEHGKDVLPGTRSQEAARRGVHATTVSRALMQVPVFIGPPLLLSTVPVLQRLVKRLPMLVLPLTTYMVIVAFGVGLPAAVAIFPEISEIEAEEVEEKFRDLRQSENGLPYAKFYYNKGL